MNKPYWVTPKCICVFAESEVEARKRCSDAGLDVKTIGMLPYPSSPQLNPDDNTSGCPPFCYTPSQCVGNSCCRKSYACTE
jgi:hypothetical protein